jgi:hypothetical protein
VPRWWILRLSSDLVFSLFDVFYQLSRADFSAIYVALRIHRYTFRCTGSFHFERVRNTVQDLAVFDAADPDSSFPSRMWSHSVGFGVGDIDHFVPNVDTARATELLPFAKVLSILVENLDAHVAPVGNKEPSLRIHCQIVRSAEFSRSRSQFAKGLYKFAVLRELGDPRDGLRRSLGILVMTL